MFLKWDASGYQVHNSQPPPQLPISVFENMMEEHENPEQRCWAVNVGVRDEDEVLLIGVSVVWFPALDLNSKTALILACGLNPPSEKVSLE